jgi:hypothetical protein
MSGSREQGAEDNFGFGIWDLGFRKKGIGMGKGEPSASGEASYDNEGRFVGALS